jgi:hypothetical protein
MKKDIREIKKTSCMFSAESGAKEPFTSSFLPYMENPFPVACQISERM